MRTSNYKSICLALSLTTLASSPIYSINLWSKFKKVGSSLVSAAKTGYAKTKFAGQNALTAAKGTSKGTKITVAAAGALALAAILFRFMRNRGNGGNGGGDNPPATPERDEHAAPVVSSVELETQTADQEVDGETEAETEGETVVLSQAQDEEVNGETEDELTEEVIAEQSYISKFATNVRSGFSGIKRCICRNLRRIFFMNISQMSRPRLERKRARTAAHIEEMEGRRGTYTTEREAAQGEFDRSSRALRELEGQLEGIEGTENLTTLRTRQEAEAIARDNAQARLNEVANELSEAERTQAERTQALQRQIDEARRERDRREAALRDVTASENHYNKMITYNRQFVVKIDEELEKRTTRIDVIPVETDEPILPPAQPVVKTGPLPVVTVDRPDDGLEGLLRRMIRMNQRTAEVGNNFFENRKKKAEAIKAAQTTEVAEVEEQPAELVNMVVTNETLPETTETEELGETETSIETIEKKKLLVS